MIATKPKKEKDEGGPANGAWRTRRGGEPLHQRRRSGSSSKHVAISGYKHQARGSQQSSRYAVPVAAASSKSSCSPNGNVVISSKSACWPGWTWLGSAPRRRKLPFSTETLKAWTRLILSRVCTTGLK